jgi:vancomycin resistance protein YoaR
VAAARARDLVVVAAAKTWTRAAATIRGWITFGFNAGQYGPIVNAADLTNALKPLAKSVLKTAHDATFLIGKNGHIAGVTASTTGQSLDVPGTLAAINTALAARAAGNASVGGNVTASVKVTVPKLTTDVARQSAPLMKAISSWTTFYNPSPAFNGNGANIAIPAQTISGTIVAPGQWFSFWKTVGDITVAKGYRLGGAIVDGHTVEGKTIGGGICSTSTTLFNAALRAGFQMGARKNHFYYISRYPVGLDATVFISDGGGSQDMTWRNDTAYPVLIKATTSFGVVKFTLYSVPNGRRVSLTRPIVTNVLGTTTIFEKTSSLPHGRTSQIEFPATGFDAQVTRTVRDASGKIVHRDTFYSHYARVVGVILVGQ